MLTVKASPVPNKRTKNTKFSYDQAIFWHFLLVCFVDQELVARLFYDASLRI